MTFAPEIVARTVSSVNDQRVRLINGRYARKVDHAEITGWTKLRVLMRICIDTSKASGVSAYYGSYAVPQFGICAGTTNTPGTATIDHAIAIVPYSTLLVYNTDTCYFSGSGNTSSFGGGIYKNGVYTSGGFYNIGSYQLQRYSTTYQPSLFGMTIYRSGSDIKFRFHIVPQCSLATFQSILSSTSDTPGGATTSSEYTVTPDEVTYGAFDSFFFTAGDDNDAWEISDIVVKKMA